MIPAFVKPFLWSYDTDVLDVVRDKRRIITNVLNLGTKKATDWLFTIYTREDIKDCLLHPLSGEWNNKSLSFWSLLMDIAHGDTTRKIADDTLKRSE